MSSESISSAEQLPGKFSVKLTESIMLPLGAGVGALASGIAESFRYRLADKAIKNGLDLATKTMLAENFGRAYLPESDASFYSTLILVGASVLANAKVRNWGKVKENPTLGDLEKSSAINFAIGVAFEIGPKVIDKWINHTNFEISEFQLATLAVGLYGLGKLAVDSGIFSVASRIRDRKTELRVQKAAKREWMNAKKFKPEDYSIRSQRVVTKVSGYGDKEYIGSGNSDVTAKIVEILDEKQIKKRPLPDELRDGSWPHQYMHYRDQELLNQLAELWAEKGEKAVKKVVAEIEKEQRKREREVYAQWYQDRKKRGEDTSWHNYPKGEDGTYL